MSSAKIESMEDVRRRVHLYLAGLSPEEAKLLRKRFRLDVEDADLDEEEQRLRHLARELSALKKQPKLKS